MSKIARYVYGWARYLVLWGIWYTKTTIAWTWGFLTRPWILAKFDAAWVEYQRGPVYRERLTNFGLGQAIYGFFNSKWERKYCLKLRYQKEPWLRWKIIFTPFSIPIPEDLIIASRDGYFNPEVKKHLGIF